MLATGQSLPCDGLSAHIRLALLPFRYALIDVRALKTDSRVEACEDERAGKCGLRILWLPDARSAAISPYDSSEWQWTRASNPQDAVRRFLDGRMEAWDLMLRV